MMNTTSTPVPSYRRRPRGMVLFTITVMAALAYAASLGPPREAGADTPAPSHMYIAAHSGKALDIPGGDQTPGTGLIQWRAHGGGNQLFRTLLFTTVGDLNFVVLKSTETGHILEGAPGQGGAVFQSTWTGSASQVWWAAPFGDTGYFLFVNMGSGHVLEVQGASRADGAPIIQWPWHGGLNQLWQAAMVIA